MSDYQLDAGEITDEQGFYAALGQAVHARDGYYGRNLDALADCLRGGFGPVPPYTLEVRGAAAARRALTRQVEIRGLALGYFDAIVAVLRQGGVTVVLS